MFARSIGRPEPIRVAFGAGCPACGGSGFHGRTAIGEAFLASEPMLRAIAERSSTGVLADLAEAAGFQSMAIDGFETVLAGLTTVEEVIAAVHV